MESGGSILPEANSEELLQVKGIMGSSSHPAKRLPYNVWRRAFSYKVALCIGNLGLRPKTSFQGDFPSLSFEEGHRSLGPGPGSF